MVPVGSKARDLPVYCCSNAWVRGGSPNMTTDRFKEFADDGLAQPAAQRARNPGSVPETLSNLNRLPRARWRSLGAHLDYTHWPERDRFLQLDCEIKAAPRDSAHQHSEPRADPSVSSNSPNRADGAPFAQRVVRRMPRVDKGDFNNVLPSQIDFLRRVKAR
jgi:hypothetical protein